ncbi:MAG: extracellular solute-binding protein [Chloroflexi bacterium]|nr:extracellular solute-binding protein [Chloroflexota bacterium]
MKIALAITAAALTVLVAMACRPAGYAPAQPWLPTSGASDWRTSWDATLAAAREEGEVTVYAAVSPEVRVVIGQAFNRRFDIGVEFVTGTATELTVKLLSERQAGLYLGDVVLAGAAPLITSMRPEGLLAPVQPVLILPEVRDGKMWDGGTFPFADRETRTVALTTQFNVGLIRNSDIVKEGYLTSFNDVLKPEWKGKLVMFDPTISGSGSSLVAAWVVGSWGLETTKEYLRGLVRQEITLTRDQRLHVEWVARGKYPLGLGGSTAHLASFMRAGAPVLPVEMAEGGYVTWGPGGLGLLVKPAHPAAATVFINWLLSREGQSVFAQAFGSPSKRVDVPDTERYVSSLPIPNGKVYVEDEEGVLARRQIITMAREIMAPLFR